MSQLEIDVKVTCKCMCGGVVTIGTLNNQTVILHTIPMCKEYEKDQDPSIYVRKVRSFQEGSS